jgi:GNAT superfamily N-acetyltransferase
MPRTAGDSIELAAPPHIQGLRFRHFRGEADLPGMLEVATASDGADQIDTARTLAGMRATYQALTHCDPFADMVLAEVDGRLVGYARGWWKDEVGGAVMHLHAGFVAPVWRRRGLGGAMLRWIEARQRAIGQQLPGSRAQLFNVYVTQGEVARAALLESAGYHIERHFFSMLRPHLQGIAPFALPAGLEIRPVVPAHYAAIWAADLEAMRGHWGMAEPQAGAFEAWQRDQDTFQPHLWSVAWDVATGQVAGQVRAFVREAENARNGRLRGYTEFISVREPWRGRGLARALIAHSLRTQARAGLTESALEVDSANATGATRTYEACGFGATARNKVYRKRL